MWSLLWSLRAIMLVHIEITGLRLKKALTLNQGVQGSSP